MRPRDHRGVGGGGARPTPGGLRDARRRPVRLLHPRYDPVCQSAAGEQSRAHRPRSPRGARRQLVPLHRLRQDRPGGAGRRSVEIIGRGLDGPRRSLAHRLRHRSRRSTAVRRLRVVRHNRGSPTPARWTMRLRPFELAEPRSLPEAIEALGRPDGEARLIGGGTALVPMIRLGLIKPDRVIALHRVHGLAELTADAGALHLGAMVSMADIERAPIVRAGWPLLADAAGRVATPAIRSSATLGGNLGYAEAASDPAAALLCLDAEIRIAGPPGERSLPVSRFLTGFYDKPLIGVAVLLVLDPDSGRCQEARIALGGAAPTAIRAARAESSLRGDGLDDRTIRTAADAAAAEVEPLSDLMGSADYRREMVRVWVRRLLTALRDGRPGSPRR